MRSGKSWRSNALLKSHIGRGGAGLVYNLGRPTDFSAAKEGRLLNLKEHLRHLKKIGWTKEQIKEYKTDPLFLFYEFPISSGKIRHIKNYSLDNRGRALKFAPIMGFDRQFIEAFYNYCAHTFLIVDDARPVFRYGVQAEWAQLFTRINHAGRACPVKNWQAAGADVAVIFHSLDHINPELFDLFTHVIQFKAAKQPVWQSIKNSQLESQLKRAFLALERLPKYSFSVTDVHFLKTQLNFKR